MNKGPMTEQQCNDMAGMDRQSPNQKGNSTPHVQNSGTRDKHTGSKPMPLMPTTRRGK
jgi:hypothetical protein